MEIEEIISVFNARKQRHNIQFDGKPEQISASRSITLWRNCVCFLPTGYGKTLCFVIPAIVTDKPTITLVVSPLISLMDNQIDSLTRWNFKCIRVGGDSSSEDMQGIARGEYTFVFTSPESALKPKLRSVFMSDVWQQRLNCIVFDEAHCISEWGEDFRPDYKEMAQLRSFFKVSVMALTATSTAKIKEDVMSILQISEDDSDIIYKSANRQNIYLQCRKRMSFDYEEELKWLIDYLKFKGKASKKIIIYCRSIDSVSEIFISIKQSLGKHAYIDQLEKSSNLLIEMFHKCTHESSKLRILTEFTKSDSSIRCLVGTIALGMGLDIKDVDMIVHIGCPKSVISYWQEAGRCARDGRQGLSLILYDNFTASLKSTEKRMAEIVKSASGTCLRQMIMDHFTVSDQEKISHVICNGCELTPCTCEGCVCCSFCSEKLHCPCSRRSVMNVDVFLKQSS